MCFWILKRCKLCGVCSVPSAMRVAKVAVALALALAAPPRCQRATQATPRCRRKDSTWRQGPLSKRKLLHSCCMANTQTDKYQQIYVATHKHRYQYTHLYTHLHPPSYSSLLASRSIIALCIPQAAQLLLLVLQLLLLLFLSLLLLLLLLASVGICVLPESQTNF